MDDWFAKLPSSDTLRSASSGVFQHVLTKGLTSWYKCQLCSSKKTQADMMSVDTAKDNRAVHVNDPIHVQRAQTLVSNRDAKIERFRETLRFDKDLHDFGRPAEIESMICRYVFQGSIKLDSIKNISKEYRQSEPLVLLELVLWKNCRMEQELKN